MYHRKYLVKFEIRRQTFRSFPSRLSPARLSQLVQDQKVEVGDGPQCALEGHTALVEKEKGSVELFRCDRDPKGQMTMSDTSAELPLLQNASFVGRVEDTWAALAEEFDAAYAAMSVKFMERTELTFHPYVKLLGFLALELGDVGGDMVEIGVWKGRSLALMQRLSGGRCKVIGIDPCAMPGQKDELRHFHRSVFPDAHLVTEYSERAVASVVRHTREIKLLHIDGGHAAFNVWADFLLYERFVRSGGYVVFDDYADAVHSPEVRVAVDEMRAMGIFDAFDVIGRVSGFDNSYLLRRP